MTPFLITNTPKRPGMQYGSNAVALPNTVNSVVEIVGTLRQQIGQLFGAPVEYALVASLCLAYASRLPGGTLVYNITWRKSRPTALLSELILSPSDSKPQNWVRNVISAFDRETASVSSKEANRPPTFSMDEISIRVSAAGVETVLSPSKPDTNWQCRVNGAECDTELAANWHTASVELCRALQLEPVVELSRVLSGHRSDRASGPTLTIVHGADGSVAPFAPLAARLAFPIRAIRYLPNVAEACVSVSELAVLYADRLLQIESTDTYWIGGHSFGAIVACEMARHLQELGKKVHPVLSLDPPSSVDMRRVLDRRDELVMLLEALFTREECEQYLAKFPLTTDIETRVRERMSPTRLQEILTNRAKCLELLKGHIWSDLQVVKRCFNVHASEPLLFDLPNNPPRPGQYVGGNHFSMLAEPHVTQLASLIESQAGGL
jgi:thioesterase domain-containing protein